MTPGTAWAIVDSVDDRARLDAWAAGDRKAGEALFEAHFQSVARFFRNKLPHASGPADDLVQQTFLGVVEAKDRFRGDSSFRTFLFAVARNVLGKHLRTKSRQKAFDPGVTSLHDLAPSPSAALARDEFDQILLGALRRLPLDLQIAVELHYWEGMTAAELAAVLDIPLGTAKTRLRRAKQLLQGLLDEATEHGQPLTETRTKLSSWARALRDDALPEAVQGD